MKKKHIFVDKKKILEAEKGIIIGLVEDGKKVKMNVFGEILFEESLDIINTTTLDILRRFEEGAILVNPQTSKDLLRKDLYERAVWGFSLMIDMFYPEGKDNKFHGFTEEAILKAQNDLLQKKVDAKK